MNTLITKYRIWFIIIPVIITILMIVPLWKAKINSDLMKYLPEHIESKINLERLEKTFGKYDPLVIIFETADVLDKSFLKRMQNINTAMIRQKEFKDVISLFELKYIRGEDGMMLVDPVITKIPETEAAIKNLREEIINNSLVYKLLVSEDFRYTMILVNPEEDLSDAKALEIINQILSANKGDENIYLSGLPFLRDEIQKKAIRDLAILFPLGLLIMISFLYLSFREMRGVWLPFTVVIISVALAMGMMPLLHYELNIIAVLIPIMMIAVANNYGVHIIARYQELNALNPRWSMKKIVGETMSVLYIPLLLTALTTIFGILGLLVHIMLPAKQMGIVSAAGIAFALILSLFFIPAVMTGQKKGKVRNNFKGDGKSVVDKFMVWAGNVVTKNPLRVIIIFLSVLIIAGTGIFYLKVSINLEKMMPVSHPLRISTQIVNTYFGGTKNISILFEGDILSPDVMHTMDEFEARLETLPEVGSVNSLATVIKTISRALYDPGDDFYNVIPDSREAIAQYIEFYNMSGDPDDFEKMVDFNYTSAILNVQFKAKDMTDFRKVTAFINELINDSEYSTLQAGQSLMEKEMSESIIRGQIYSLLFAMSAIALLLGLIFKSFTAGIMGIIPLLFALICNFGLMGWSGFDLDIATSLLSSVAIGIGVDYIIHFFWRIKFELKREKNYKSAIVTTLNTTGRGIAINAFSVIIGFSVLLLSGLTILKTFGLLIIFSLLLCLLCALLLVPAICLIFRPGFLLK